MKVFFNDMDSFHIPHCKLPHFVSSQVIVWRDFYVYVCFYAFLSAISRIDYAKPKWTIVERLVIGLFFR